MLNNVTYTSTGLFSESVTEPARTASPVTGESDASPVSETKSSEPQEFQEFAQFSDTPKEGSVIVINILKNRNYK